MSQVNLHVTAEFEQALEALVRGRGLSSKSEAIRQAVQEAAAPYLAARQRDFSALQGLLGPAGSPGRRSPPMAVLERKIDEEMERALLAPARGGAGGVAKRARKPASASAAPAAARTRKAVR